ncbi:MAG TPA: hypothetical protein VGT08_01725 [Terracidiphilus sp.]|nr:hypothetical protein [Terracidiphilus sp.]
MSPPDHWSMGVHIGPAEEAPQPEVKISAPPPPAPIPAPAQVIPMAPTSTANEVAKVAQDLRDAIRRANAIMPATAAAVAEFHRRLDVMEGYNAQLVALNKTLTDLEPT